MNLVTARLNNVHGPVERTADGLAVATLQTWDAAVTVALDARGGVQVVAHTPEVLEGTDGPHQVLVRGNVHEHLRAAGGSTGG